MATIYRDIEFLKQIPWESTLNEGVFAMAPDPQQRNVFYGAVADWSDGGDGEGRHFTSFIVEVDINDYFGTETDPWEKAENMMLDYKGTILADFGWFFTRHEAGLNVMAHIAPIHNFSERCIRDY